MTEREILIELLDIIIQPGGKTLGDIADYLIANGVIVPRKVGDTVYVIEPCTCYNNYSEFDKCHHKRTKATKWIEMARVPKKHFTKCLKLMKDRLRLSILTSSAKQYSSPVKKQNRN